MTALATFVQAVVAAAHAQNLHHALDVANCLAHDGGVGDGAVLAAAVLALAGVPAPRECFPDEVHAVLDDWRGDRVWPEAVAIELADIVVRQRASLGPRGAPLPGHLQQRLERMQLPWWDGACRRLARLVEAQSVKLKME